MTIYLVLGTEIDGREYIEGLYWLKEEAEADAEERMKHYFITSYSVIAKKIK